MNITEEIFEIIRRTETLANDIKINTQLISADTFYS